MIHFKQEETKVSIKQFEIVHDDDGIKRIVLLSENSIGVQSMHIAYLGAALNSVSNAWQKLTIPTDL